MSAKQIVMAAAGAAGAPTYVDDVFSTFLYTGVASSAVSVNNGIDLAGKGGLVWVKKRAPLSSNLFDNHYLADSSSGVNNRLSSNSTGAQSSGGFLDSFNSSGFTVSANGVGNQLNEQLVSWTFRKQAKFFDVLGYAGDNVFNRPISHSLAATPGCIIVKMTSATVRWFVYHRSIWNSSTQSVPNLNTDSPATSADFGDHFGSTAPTSAQFFVAYNNNSPSQSYVAYLFAHDTSADGLIQCGSYTGNGSATGPTVTLGWEPQWLMIKRATGGTGNWNIFDNMRGMTVGGDDWYLEANTAGAEASANWITPTASGFQIVSTSTEVNNNTSTYIYVAIRRSNKPPTAGTQVFQPTIYTANFVNNRLVNTTIAPDMVFARRRDANTSGLVVGDRMRGQPYLRTGTTAAEVNSANAFDALTTGNGVEWGTAFSAQNGYYVGLDINTSFNSNNVTNNHVALAFKRAAKFFDVVCYTGTGANRTFAHSLATAPELVIVKARSAASTNWSVYYGSATQFLVLNTNAIPSTNSTYWNNTSPTSIEFSLGNSSDVNNNNTTYIAYLFGSLAGVSKVGTYTGNGSSQTINCGFAAGARFVLIKRTDAAGDWYVWDTARGIVSGNDPRLGLNSSTSEVATDDSIDPDSSGFIVNQVSATNINVTGATYLYLAIA